METASGRARIIFLLLFFFFVLNATHGQATENATRVLTDVELEDVFREIVFENSIWPRQDLRVTGFSVKPQSLTIPAGTVGYKLRNQAHANHLGKKTLLVTILVDGKECGKVKMVGNVQLYGDVICTTKRLSRHTVLSRDDIKIIRRNIAMLNDRITGDPADVIGKRLTTSLKPGAIVYKHLLEPPPLVKRGDMVSIVAQSDRLRITAPGEVRNAGALGDLVRVKNLMSRREIYARVIGPGEVETEF